jgi:hypothetical protein
MRFEARGVERVNGRRASANKDRLPAADSSISGATTVRLQAIPGIAQHAHKADW